jgi:hypothetical protein
VGYGRKAEGATWMVVNGMISPFIVIFP